MRCTNCGFQNMPGSDACGRCGTSLGLATAVIDVTPPRAGRAAKAFRRAVPFRRAYHGVRDVVVPKRAGGDGLTPILARLPVLARLVVPGWAHFYLGQRWRGHLYLWGYLACLVPGLLLFGTLWGSINLGLAFSGHVTAALDLAGQSFAYPTFLRRLWWTVRAVAALVFFVYLPAGWLVTRVAEPRTVMMFGGPLRPGDGVLVTHLGQRKPGELVLYDLGWRQETYRNGHTNTYLRLEGERIDRILAGPGDRVRWEGGRLLVNDVESPLRPLYPAALPPRLDLTVPGDSFFIPPTAGEANGHPRDPRMWAEVGCVPRSRVVGRVWARNQPPTRMQLIR